MTRIPLSVVDAETKGVQEKLEMSTAEIGLSVRTTNCLEERGIFTVNDLLHRTPEDLLSISNFGEKTLEEVYKALDKIGFKRRRKEVRPAAIRSVSLPQPRPIAPPRAIAPPRPIAPPEPALAAK